MLDGTLHTVSYAPPLRLDDKFLVIGKGTRILARVDGGHFTIHWPDGTEAKGKIIRRERINPDQRQHNTKHPPGRYAIRNSFVRSSLIVSLSLAAFSNSNRLADSRISFSSFAMYASSSSCDLNSGIPSPSAARSV